GIDARAMRQHPPAQDARREKQPSRRRRSKFAEAPALIGRKPFGPHGDRVRIGPPRVNARAKLIPNGGYRLPTCKMRDNGEGEIRTPATLSGRPVFETGAFNRSATSPDIRLHKAFAYISRAQGDRQFDAETSGVYRRSAAVTMNLPCLELWIRRAF